MEKAAARCPACGAPATERLAGGMCPGCLVALALEQRESDGACRILALLGGNDARTLYLAEDEEARRLVTLDVVRAAAAPAMTPGLFEARVAELAGLRHPGIVRVLGGRVTPRGDYCVVSDYVPGRHVESWALSALPGASDVASVLDQVCDAVGHAHLRHVVHGRLAPPVVVLRVGERGTAASIGGYSVCEDRATEEDDVAALGRLLAVLAQRPEVAARVAPLLQRASRPPRGGGFRTVHEFRAAAQRQLGVPPCEA